MMPNNTTYEGKPSTLKETTLLNKPSKSSLNMRENPRQSLVHVNTLDKFEKDENLVRFITKKIDEVLNKRMDVIEQQIQEHFRRLHIINK